MMLFVISFEILPFIEMETFTYNALIKSHNERLQEEWKKCEKS